MEDIINEDVAIIGGGAFGTYAAVRLREDFNVSVVVVETKDHLGGHVDTYTVPETNTTVEYSVQSYISNKAAVDFFKRFDIETSAFVARRLTTIYVDYNTSKEVTGYKPPTANATNESFQKWLPIVEKYNHLVEPGYWNFPRPKDIPTDFLAPFGDFARKYGISSAIPRITAISNVGVGGLEHIPTFLQNSLLYQRAYELLKNDVYLSSHVDKAERTSSGIKLVVKQNGKAGAILIKAKKLLYTAAPRRVPNLEGFDDDMKEAKVFDQFQSTWNHVGIVEIPCIPENYAILYISPDAVPDKHTSIRNDPRTLRFESTGPVGLQLFRVRTASGEVYTADEAKEWISFKVQQLVDAGTLNSTTGECKVEFKAFGNHNSVEWPNNTEVYKNGWVQRLNALQGYRGTWWTGGKWSADYTSNVWVFTDTVIERMLNRPKKRN
ncbi:FAD/NAD(P)-binding domain-containing protein [Amniculicola lignicola CBS 123094]|uniref:FAD/NAD(P)-binding domain-containing protein n=1 Tax=Amniculicola lignicola CBS 123094 TaxID=1392246 RepID=A0A6A5WQF5_9PLEO|nr:FAD/NAD(P)-binding domain-containing protein [Amniculicola lignicola CBS 123094]